MPKFKISVIVEIEADDIDEARVIAAEFALRGNDSVYGDVGDIIAKRVDTVFGELV